MRIDLRPQRPQFGVPRQDLELELAPLGLTRRLERDQHVVDRQGEQEQQHADGKHRRHLLSVAVRRRR